MKESMAPVLYVRTLPIVVNGFQLINRAEAGCQGQASNSVFTPGSGTSGAASADSGSSAGSGNIANGWVSSTSQSTTVVNNYTWQYPLPNQLPKTGY